MIGKENGPTYQAHPAFGPGRRRARRRSRTAGTRRRRPARPAREWPPRRTPASVDDRAWHEAGGPVGFGPDEPVRRAAGGRTDDGSAVAAGSARTGVAGRLADARAGAGPAACFRRDLQQFLADRRRASRQRTDVAADAGPDARDGHHVAAVARSAGADAAQPVWRHDAAAAAAAAVAADPEIASAAGPDSDACAAAAPMPQSPLPANLIGSPPPPPPLPLPPG